MARGTPASDAWKATTPQVHFVRQSCGDTWGIDLQHATLRQGIF